MCDQCPPASDATWQVVGRHSSTDTLPSVTSGLAPHPPTKAFRSLRLKLVYTRTSIRLEYGLATRIMAHILHYNVYDPIGNFRGQIVFKLHTRPGEIVPVQTQPASVARGRS